MYRQTLAIACVVASVTGCAARGSNPVDYVTYHNEPLVKQVEEGMSRDKVLTLGGPPSTEVKRSVYPGTCNNYVLNHDGKEQPYHVSFNASGHVDHKGFTTCEEFEKYQREHL
jgi:osmotically inducible lipoprotein OsmE